MLGGQPFPSPADLPDPGIKPTSVLQVDSLPLIHLGSLRHIGMYGKKVIKKKDEYTGIKPECCCEDTMR